MTPPDLVDPELIGAARRSAETAAERSGVVIRPLTELAEFVACEHLWADIWGRDEGPPVAANVLRAHSSAGSYVVGAYDDNELLAGCLGFWGPPARRSLHSHIAGVSPAARGRDLGYALKLHQRAVALAADVPLITWTYDPLIARNAHFNLRKLGGRAAKYMINYYGVMPDAINAGDETDRIELHWELDSPSVRAACDGPGLRQAQPAVPEPAEGPGPRRAHSAVRRAEPAVVEIPSDIEGLRRTDPDEGVRWRRRLRDRLVPVLQAGGRIVDFDRERGGYLIEEAT